tara:strand:- start:139 stop:351 length:213 start_codon:yes stop_codon:yes gene_type:complete
MNHENLMWMILIVNTFFLLREFKKSIRLSKELDEAREMLETRGYTNKSKRVVEKLQEEIKKLKEELRGNE